LGGRRDIVSGGFTEYSSFGRGEFGGMGWRSQSRGGKVWWLRFGGDDLLVHGGHVVVICLTLKLIGKSSRSDQTLA